MNCGRFVEIKSTREQNKTKWDKKLRRKDTNELMKACELSERDELDC